MKIVLSRKGFDSGYGGCASPIFPDGTMISMPIPEPGANIRYDYLHTENGKDYYTLWCDLLGHEPPCETCHLDPDIKKEIISSRPENWRPAFGQINAAQTHIENQGIKEGDIFLFFGWFRKTVYQREKLIYMNDQPDIHAIYAYLQIGNILKGNDVKKCPWHPHSDDSHIYNKNGDLTNNTIFVAAERLIIDEHDMDFPGAGVFRYTDNIVLTAPQRNRTEWKLNDVFKNVCLTYHSSNSIKDGYFKSAKRGQEFVFDESHIVTDWLKTIIEEQKHLH